MAEQDDPTVPAELSSEELATMIDKLQDKGGGPVAADPAGPPPAVFNVPESPTLLALSKEERPDPLPLCGVCPKSMWLSGSHGLKCFCRVMHVVTWDSDDPQPILQCDGAMEEE